MLTIIFILAGFGAFCLTLAICEEALYDYHKRIEEADRRD